MLATDTPGEMLTLSLSFECDHDRLASIHAIVDEPGAANVRLTRYEMAVLVAHRQAVLRWADREVEEGFNTEEWRAMARTCALRRQAMLQEAIASTDDAWSRVFAVLAENPDEDNTEELWEGPLDEPD